jgi:Tol biopolymer transport system component
MLMLAGSITLAGCGGGSPSPASPAGPSADLVGHMAQVGKDAAAQAPATNVDVSGPGGAPVVTPPASTAGGGSTVSGSSGGGGGSSPSGGGGPVAPVPPVVAPVWGTGDFIAFSSNRKPGEGKGDIYVFDPYIDTVLAIVGVNTHDNELNPRISDNGKFLVFQRAWKEKKGYHRYGYNQDILLYNMDLKLVNTLPMLNTEDFDEYQADISNDGCNIVYVTEVEKGYPELRLFDLTTGDNWAVPGANRNFRDVTWPTISANGKRIAYGASIYKGFGGPAEDLDGNDTGGDAYTGNPLYFGESNVYIYDIPTGTQLTPPFVNTAFDEYDPELCFDGTRMMFVSNRLGTEDIFEVNLDTGWTDNLSFLNTNELDEQHPMYLGGSVDRVVFQITNKDSRYSNYYDFIQLRAYNRATATLDTLPIANHILADSALRAPQPETLP